MKTYGQRRREMNLLDLLRESRPQTTTEEAQAIAAGLEAGTIIVQGTNDPEEALILLMEEEAIGVHHCHGLEAAKDYLTIVFEKYPGRRLLLLEEKPSSDHSHVDKLIRFIRTDS